MEIVLNRHKPDAITGSNLTDLTQTFHLHRRLRLLGFEDYIKKYGDGIRSRLKRLETAKPLLDVVVPAYNEEGYLPACLDALSRQTAPIQVLVVNNGSTDKTAGIAERLGVHRIVDQSQPGIGAAKKAGILATSSPLFLMTDADSAPVPNWSTSMLKSILEDTRFLAAYSPVLFHDANTPTLYAYNLLSITGKFVKDLLRVPHYQGNSTICRSQIRDWMEEESDPQAGDDGPIFRLIKKRSQTVTWSWDVNSLVFTSARRIKAQGLGKVFFRRIVHLLIGNSDFAYYSLYSDRERGSLQLPNSKQIR